MSKYEEGAKAEFVVAEMLKSDGWYIANASRLDEVAGEDNAPLVRGEDDAKITPDILAMKDGRTAWIEVKFKKDGAFYYVKKDKYEHFIDGKNWRSYLEIESSSGCEVWLAIIEQPDQTLQRQLISDIDVIGWWSETDVEQNSGGKYGEPGVFVPQDCFMPTNVPAELAGKISEQRQLNGTVETGETVLPEQNAGTKQSTDNRQRGLGDFATDGGDTHSDATDDTRDQ